MSLLWVHILLPFLAVAFVYDTEYIGLLICTLPVIAIISFIRRKNVWISFIYVSSAIIALCLCNSTYSISNKSFYPLLEKPVTLTCVVDDTPIVSEGRVSYTTKMISAISAGEEFALDGKVMLDYAIDDNKSIPQYADVLKLKTKLSVPEKGRINYRRHLNSTGIFVSCKAEDAAIVNCGKYENANPLLYAIFGARDYLINKCNSYFGGDTATFMKALLLGYKTDFSKGVQSDITRSGISHIVAISGLHLSVLVSLITFLIRKLKASAKIKFLAVPLLNIICALFITAITGFSPSVKRAAIMMVWANVASLFYRETDSRESLSVAVLLLIIENPCAVYDIRLILSALAVAGIVLCSERIEGFIGKFVKSKFLRETCAVSVSAQVFTLPVAVYSFNTISALSLAANLIIVPIIPYIMAAGLIFLVTPFDFLADFFSGGIWLAIQFIFKTIHLISAIPFAQIKIGITKFMQILTPSALAFLFIMATIRCRKTATKAICFTAACAFSFLLFFPIRSADFTISAIDTGKGEATFIKFPCGKTMLVDCGLYPTGNSAKSVEDYLLEKGVGKIDYIVASSLGSGNINNILYLAGNMKTGSVILPDCPSQSATDMTDNIISRCKGKNIPVYLMDSKDGFSHCENCKVQILFPFENEKYENSSNSTVVKATANNRSVLLAGDIKESESIVLLKEDINADILKFTKNTSHKIIKAVSPEFAYIFTDEADEDTAKLLAEDKVTLFSVFSSGTVEFKINKNGQIRIK